MLMYPEAVSSAAAALAASIDLKYRKWMVWAGLVRSEPCWRSAARTWRSPSCEFGMVWERRRRWCGAGVGLQGWVFRGWREVGDSLVVRLATFVRPGGAGEHRSRQGTTSMALVGGVMVGI